MNLSLLTQGVVARASNVGRVVVTACAVIALTLLCATVAVAGVNSWSPTGGPRGANVVDLEPFSGGVLAAALQDGVYWTGDAGVSWQRMGASFSPGVVWTRDVAVSEAATFFAATNNGVYQVMGAGGTWEPAGADTVGVEMASVVVAGDEVVVAGKNWPATGVVRSTDGGATWGAPSADVPDTVWCLAASETTIIAGTNGDGLWASADGGQNWARAGTGIPDTAQINDVVLSGSTGYAAADVALYRTTDGGGTWTMVQGGTHTCVGIEFGGAVVAGQWMTGIHRSVDGGDTWVFTGDSNPGRWPRALATIGYTVLAGYEGPGVYRTTAAGSVPWVEGVAGLPQLESRCAAFGPGGAMFVSADTASGMSAGLLKSTDGGVTWKNASYELAARTVFDLASSSTGTLYSAGALGVWQTTDGNTWTQVGGVLPGAASAIAVSQDGGMLLAAGSGWAATKHTADVDWTPVDTTGLPASWTYSAVVASDGSLLLGKGDAIYRLASGGVAWSVIPDVNGVIYELARRNDGRLYASGSMIGTSTAVFKSADHGATWTPLPGTGNDVRTLAVMPYGNFIFACVKDLRVVRSTTDGTDWQQAGSTIPGATHLAAAGAFGPLMVGTTAGVQTYEFVAPEVTLGISPSEPAAVDGWYRGPRSILLNRPVSGATYYSVDGGSTLSSVAAVVTLAAVEGSHTVKYYGSTWGIGASSHTDIVRVDGTPPSGSVSLQGGLAQTSRRIGTFDSAVTDPGDGSGLVDMRVQVGGVWGPWMPYASTITVTLPAWDGTKLVAAEYRDRVGNVFSASDTIYYKRPKAAVSIPRLSVTSPRRGVYFACAGTITPRVYGSDKVRVYRKNSLGRWVAYGTYSAANSKYGTGSKYRAVIRIAKRGSYRMRVYYPGSSTVAPSTSGWKYFSVK